MRRDDESIAGTNPRILEATPLELRETPHTGNSFIEIDSQLYESFFPAQRPYNEHIEDSDYSDYNVYRYSDTLTIELDELGTGSYSHVRVSGNNSDTQTSSTTIARNKKDNAIELVISDQQSSSGAGSANIIEITIETTAIGTQQFRHDGTRSYKTYTPTQSTSSYTLIGTLIDNSDLCEPISGTIVYDSFYGAGNEMRQDNTTKISKDSNDLYWLYSVIGPSGQLVEQYYLRTLGIKFYCGYSELR